MYIGINNQGCKLAIASNTIFLRQNNLCDFTTHTDKLKRLFYGQKLGIKISDVQIQIKINWYGELNWYTFKVKNNPNPTRFLFLNKY